MEKKKCYNKTYIKQEEVIFPEITNFCPCPCSEITTESKFIKGHCLGIDVDYTVWKLKELVLDPITRDDTSRISQLLYEYEEGLQDGTYMVKHLPAVIDILIFLSENAKTVDDYRKHLSRMLDFCARPPLLETTSQGLICSDIMTQYFILLSHLLVALTSQEEILKVHEAFRSLLIRTAPSDPSAVKAVLCRTAMEGSNLALVLTDILNTSSPEGYPTVLESVFLISSVSSVCSHKMIEAGILNPLLIRLDLPYATQVFCKPPPAQKPLEGDEYSDDTMFLIMNILWTLTRSILPPKGTPVYLKDLRAPVQCALWGLRYGLKRHIQKSNNRKFNARIRNEMAMLVLVLLQLFPPWIIISSGIADDVFCFLNGCVSETIHVWSNDIKFVGSKENLVFVKILLLIVSNLTEVDACIPIMIERKVLQSLLQLIDVEYKNSKSIWSPSQFWYLFELALCILAKLVPKMPEEFVKYGGTQKLILILEWCLSNELDSQFTVNYTRTIYSIAKSKNSILLNDFREQQVILRLIKLIDHILDIDTLTMDHQRILTILLLGIEEIIKNEPSLQYLYGEKNIQIVTRMLERCLYRKQGDFQRDQRLLLAIGSYIWQCIIQCPTHFENFIDKGTIYTILDVIEIACSPVRCLFLGLLTDICDSAFCGQYLCTWRGIDKKKGFMSLLAKIWREEEIQIGVKKQSDGPIEDVELPQMGVEQWRTTYHNKIICDVSPTMIDMIGSSRSKIYGLRKIIEKYNEKYQMAKDHYKILINDLPIEDRVTMSCVDLYFRLKLGEAWVEVTKYLAQVGVAPLGMDGQVTFLMTKRHRSWGLFIQERQKKLKIMANNIEEIEEKDEYARIRDSLLAPTFDALDELEYVRRTTDRTYMLKMKDLQNQQVNASLNFPPGTDIMQCRRTHQDNVNVTAVLDQHLYFVGKHVPENDLDAIKVSPISPVESSVWINSSLYDADLSECSCCIEEESLESFKDSKKKTAMS
ncbi:hypothetical protein KPH14_002093 [Odynerus spinipes]|uniref:Cilia- and flagella-associated protein 69 ARM repeats domain-containing protein n=1 Tax=Odynerus spinipes TaxID=1348599 RepID=A0AAD9VPR4_9HYME|nr:hypothetical protein KPH14_002093 [Odynerus spinipes]